MSKGKKRVVSKYTITAGNVKQYIVWPKPIEPKWVKGKYV